MSVEVDANGVPRMVVQTGRRQVVMRIADAWQVEDEWWREPVARRYYRLLLDDDRSLTVYQDLVTGAWYAQHDG